MHELKTTDITELPQHIADRLRSIMKRYAEIAIERKRLSAEEDELKLERSNILYGDLNREYGTIIVDGLGSFTIIPESTGSLSRKKLEDNLLKKGIPASVISEAIAESLGTRSEYVKYSGWKGKG